MAVPPADIVVRRARTADVKAIRGFVDAYAPERKLLNKPTVTLYEDVQEFWVAEQASERRGPFSGRLRRVARHVGRPGRGAHAGR